MEQKSSKKVYIIHGWEGTPEANWFPWLKKELTQKGIDAIVPLMPNTNNPNCVEWVNFLQKNLINPDENTYLVGHSLGVITILRYLELLPEGLKIGGAILVAGFSEPIGLKELDNFFQTSLNYEKVKNSAKMFVAIHSDNDHIVPIEKGYLLKDRLGAELVIIPNAGHLNEGDGYFKLPIILKFIK